jgi:hypothetical protein
LVNKTKTKMKKTIRRGFGGFSGLFSTWWPGGLIILVTSIPVTFCLDAFINGLVLDLLSPGPNEYQISAALWPYVLGVGLLIHTGAVLLSGFVPLSEKELNFWMAGASPATEPAHESFDAAENFLFEQMLALTTLTAFTGKFEKKLHFGLIILAWRDNKPIGAWLEKKSGDTGDTYRIFGERLTPSSPTGETYNSLLNKIKEKFKTRTGDCLMTQHTELRKVFLYKNKEAVTVLYAHDITVSSAEIPEIQGMRFFPLSELIAHTDESVSISPIALHLAINPKLSAYVRES